LIGHDQSSKLAKKYQKFVQKLQTSKENAKNGAIMGTMVGGLFGFVVGALTAFQTRRFITIPISTVISGVSFGFILGCGSIIRSAELNYIKKEMKDHDGKYTEIKIKEDVWMYI
jgi:hypothetical protein